MPATTPTPVLVAVDGSEGSAAAVRYGAVEARRLDRPLRLLHVAPDYLPIAALVPLSTPLSTGDFEEVGRGIVKDALAIARTLLPADRVTGGVAIGQRVPVLLDAAAEACLVVLGDDRTPLMERVAVGTLVGSLAARSPVPVVSVPEKWTEGDHPAASARIVLGVKDYDRVPPELLRAAFQLADEHRATLEIAYVWDFPASYGDMVIPMMDYPGWQAMVDHHLRVALAGLHEEFPEVAFEISASYGQPAHILRDRSAGAALLLLARRAHGFPLGHFGSTGRALLRASLCPVEVLPEPEIDRTPVPTPGTSAPVTAG